MDTILKFKEAAKALQQDELYTALHLAQQASDEDKELQDMIGEFNLLRLDLNNEMTKDERDEARIAEMNQKASAVYNKIMANDAMMAYNQAKKGIEEFMEYVNAILNTAIEGGDPMTVEKPESACGSGGCSGCSGCS